MKKVFALLLAASCILSSSAFAAGVKVSVPGTEQISETTYEETAKTIDVTLMVAASVLALTDTKDVVATINVESDSEKPVALKLNLNIEENNIAEGKTAIDYIDLKIENSDGKVLFEDTDSREKGSNSREIVFDILNDENSSESQTYDIYMSAADDVKMAEIVNRLSDIEWAIELDSDEKAVALSEQELSEQKTITITVDTATDKDGGKVAAGRYGFIGNGICTITSADGTNAQSFKLVDDEAKATYVTVKKGDTITITGDKNAKLKLLNEKTITTTNPSKTNPKTGDSAPVTYAFVAAFLAVALMIVAAKGKKRED